jgi:uncharacterized repeat protein (TIGR01451 family)
MSSWRKTGTGRRIAAIAIALLGGSLLGATAAVADGTVSPTGMVAVSVPPPVVAGVASTYTMTVTDTTPGPLQSIVASGTIPTGMSLKGITGCARLGGNQSSSFLCSLPGLAPGASETATFSLLASAAGGYQISFSAAGQQPVPGSPGVFQVVGDTATVSVDAQAGPTDLQVTGSSNNGSPAVGSTVTYTFQVKNNGPLPASAVTLDDPLPAALPLGTTVTIGSGTCTADTAANSVHCDVGSLDVGQQSVVTLSATPTATGVFGNTATVTMAGTDTHPANNSVTVTVQPR